MSSSSKVLLSNYLLGQASGSVLGKNYVKNSMALQNVANVTASGSATVTRNTTTPLTAIADFSISLPNNATDYVEWSLDTLDNALKGQNCELRFDYTASSIGSNVVAQVYQGSNLIAQSSVLATQTNSTPVSVNAPCGDLSSATTVRIANGSGNSGTSSLKVANVYHGKATNLGYATVDTNWTSYTPTFGADFGTPSSVSFFYKQEGDTLHVQGTFITGTLSSANGGITIPSGYTIDSTKVSINNTNTTNGPVIGRWTQGDHANYFGNIVSATATATNKIYFANQFSNASPGPLVPGDFSGIGFSNTKTSVNFSVPIVANSSMVTFNPNLQALSWSGYFNNNCSWSTSTTGSFVDPSNTGNSSCNLVEVSNTNFGTVSPYGGTGTSALPGIIFTPKKTGKYRFCATSNYGTTTGATAYLTVNDGAETNIGDNNVYSVNNGVASSNEYHVTQTCANYNVSSLSSVTLKVKLRTSGGSAAIFNTGVSTPIGFSIFALDQNIPAPVLVGSVTSGSTGAERIERVQISGACSSSPCTLQSSTGGISSVTRSSTGVYAINFVSGAFSVTPTCSISSFDGGLSICAGINTGSSTTVFNYKCWNSGFSLSDNGISATCTGPR